MTAKGNNGNQPQPRPPRLIISLPDRRNPPLILNPQAAEPIPDLSLSLFLGSPRERQGPHNDDNNQVDISSSSSWSVESEVVSIDEDNAEGVNSPPPMVREVERETARMRMQARRLLAIRKRRRTRAAMAAAATVQGKTCAHIVPQRAMASTMHQAAPLRALPRKQQVGLMSPRHPMYGRRNMNRVRIPRGMPRLHIVLPRNRMLSFGISESLVKRARDAEVNQFVANVVQMIPRAISMGNGPLGRRIEGFLYKFRGEEELKIVCVCHGRLFSPTGFFKHAGGTDVPNPSRYITIVGVPPSFINGPNGYPNPNPNGNGNVNEDENNNEDVDEVSLDGDDDGN